MAIATDTVRGVLRCDCCRQEIPQLTADRMFMAVYRRLFERAHRECRPGMRPPAEAIVKLTGPNGAPLAWPFGVE